MKQLLGWLQANSAALQGIVAMVVIISALVAIPSYLKSVSSHELSIRLKITPSTLPPKLISFNKSIVRLVC